MIVDQTLPQELAAELPQVLALVLAILHAVWHHRAGSNSGPSTQAPNVAQRGGTPLSTVPTPGA